MIRKKMPAQEFCAWFVLYLVWGLAIAGFCFLMADHYYRLSVR